MFQGNTVVSQNSQTSCHDPNSNGKADVENSHQEDGLTVGVQDSSGTAAYEAVSVEDCTSVFKGGEEMQFYL